MRAIQPLDATRARMPGPALAAMVCAFAMACGGGDGTPLDTGMGVAAGVSQAGTMATSGAGSSSSGGGAGGMGAGGTAGVGGSSAGLGGAGGAVAGMGGMAGSGGSMIDPNGGAPTGPASTRQVGRPAGSVQGTTAGYFEYVPPHYGNGALYPLLVFRHGVGENGNGVSDLPKILAHGPPKLIQLNQWPEDRPFVVLSVQHTGDGCPTSGEIDDFINFAIDNYDIDTKRVYLTGLSCGAIGSWNYLGDHTNETVAASVLIAGDGRNAFTKAGCNLGKEPIWAFHGEADMTVDPQGSIQTLMEIKACSNPAPVDARLTTYPGVGHDSWTMTYNLSNPQNDIYAWMLSHTK